MRQSNRGAFGWLVIFAGAASATALPPNFYDETVGDNWNQAVGLTFSASGRMFVWEKAGRVWEVEDGAKAAAPLIDISQEVGDWRDYGLLGFALDPDFDFNGHIYLLYVVDYHHLLYFGTPQYNPNANWFFHDTIGRLTRYTCNASDGFRTVNHATRLVLVGESIDTGFPICHQSHGVGWLEFGADGTLLASCGDGASFEDVDTGGCRGNSSCTCLSDGIITVKEDVGSFRSQLVDSLSGKIIRIDPATGDGLPDNPFFDNNAPRSPRSRLWTLGLRNPYRFTIRPGTGGHHRHDAHPGTIYLGDVGWSAWEEMSIARQGGANLGWPIYEGMNEMPLYAGLDIPNQDAPNPLFGTIQPGFGPCDQEFFTFDDLLVQDTLASPAFPNPCNPNLPIPNDIPAFVHRRPAFDWGRSLTARVSSYAGINSVVHLVNDPNGPVTAPMWSGNASTGGAWYVADDFPEEYQNSYFHADFGGRWIRRFQFDENDRPLAVHEFLEDNSSAIVAIAAPPTGGLYYIGYDQSGCCMVHRITYVDNFPPFAQAAGSPLHGPAPLNVQFSSAGSMDPDPMNGSGLTYAWDFGDGTPVNTQPNPQHVFQTTLDVTSLGSFTAKVFSLNPPHPIGGGNWNPEVMRDGDFPPVGNMSSLRQYDTYHAGDQGATDWVGYTFPDPVVFTKIVFQEGKHFFDGGWFDSLTLQVRSNGNWTDVPSLNIVPPYAGNNGINFESYLLTFPPVTGDGIRLHGDPGGSANFISVGEFRVHASSNNDPQRFDVTLTVTDVVGASDSASLIVSINNTPPSVIITSPINGSSWPADGSPTLLRASIMDMEHPPEQLTCRWQTILHHNDHEHPEPFDFDCSSSTVLSPVGHEGETYYYEVRLTVTDAHGLSTTKSSFVYPPKQPIPAASTWGLVAFALTVGIAATLMLRRPAALPSA